MTAIKRRSVLRGAFGTAAATVIPFETWFGAQAHAAGPVLTRFDVASTQGQAMLDKYRIAVGLMKGLPAGNPSAWQFQWYTHNVKSSTTKAAAIAAIYPAGSSPADKALAQAMWDTCQAHFGRPLDMFLPWHRIYVYYLENIVRSVLKDPTFTLPYWNYSAQPTRAMPAAFRKAGTSLFSDKRNAGPNAGKGIPAGSVALDALDEPAYADFNAQINGGIHGAVHVWVGNQTEGMGSVPWAANDPIFWMHHSNIDRLWASWNKAGRKNPSDAWLTQKFTFADGNGKQVMATVGNFDQISKLNYTYDRFEPVTPVPPAQLMAAATVHLQSTGALVDATSGPVALGAAPVHVTMKSPPAAPANAMAFAAVGATLGPSKTVKLLLDNLTADGQPGVLFDVYLDLPAGTAPDPDGPNYAGTINFFAVNPPHADHGGQPVAQNFSLNVTRMVRELAAAGKLTDTPSVTIVPQGAPDAAAKPAIGGIRIVGR